MNIEFKYLIGSVIGGEAKNLCYIQKFRNDSEWGPIDTALTFDSFEEAMKWILEYGSIHLGLDHGFSLVQVSSSALDQAKGSKFNMDMFVKLHDPIYMLR